MSGAGKIEFEEGRDIRVEKHVYVEVDHVSLRVRQQERSEHRRPGEDVPTRAFARRNYVGVRFKGFFDVNVSERHAGEARDYGG